MEQTTEKPHPYHYWEDKSFMQRLIDWTVPIALFFLYFFLYNFGAFTPSEMIKTTGLLAIMLLSITLVVGPAGRFIPSLNILKAHRKFWGISSFVILVVHAVLVIMVYFKGDVLRLFNTASPKFMGFTAGLLATFVLLAVVASSFHWVIKRLHPGVWKKLQTTSYIALTLAVAHFYLMEQKEGVLVIKRSLGKITFLFATLVIIVRLLVFFLPKKENA